MPSTKTTSLATLTEALTEHGWTFESTEREVRVPDPDSPHVRTSGYSGRVTHMPTKPVPGVVVSARNGDEEAQKSFSAQFTAEGKYLAQHTSGGYPFSMKGITLKRILAEVEQYAPQRLASRRAARAAEMAERDEQEARDVLAAHTEAKEKLVAARSEIAQTLMAKGLSAAQASVVMETVQSGEFGPFLNALAAVERTGKGWLPGKTFVSGTYVNGVRVS